MSFRRHSVEIQIWIFIKVSLDRFIFMLSCVSEMSQYALGKRFGKYANSEGIICLRSSFRVLLTI